MLALLLPIFAIAGESESEAYIKRSYWEARERYAKLTNQVEAAWQFGRACFDRADIATNLAERAEFAEQGIGATRKALERDPRSAPAHYYLAMNLGQLAETRGLGALKLVDEMEQEFLRTRDLDEKFDYAGANRNLGLLYREAPSLLSIGSRTKSGREMRRAVELAPGYPDNHLNLIEACLKWSDRNGAKRALNAYEKALPQARTNFTGLAWKASWTDWDSRYRQAKAKIEEPPRVLEAPRHSD
jgi:hypothetical protein